MPNHVTIKVGSVHPTKTKKNNEQLTWCRQGSDGTAQRKTHNTKIEQGQSFTASMLTNMLLHLILEHDVRVEECSVLTFKLASDRIHISAFVGGEGVQGVLTLFGRGKAQVCHNLRVEELREQLGVEEEDGDRQEEEVEEKGEIESKRVRNG